MKNNTVKKSIIIGVAAAMIGTIAFSGGAAHAQLFTYTGTSTAPSSSVIMATTTATMSPVSVVAPSYSSGYLQIDGLTVTGMTSSALPSQLLVLNTSYPSIAADGSMVATTTEPITCQQFITDSSPIGIQVTCPAPPVAPPLPGATSTPTSVTYSPYAVNISAATQLLLGDRTPAILANITAGDIVNVYGYYNSGDGSFNAEVVRDLSKPAGPLTTLPGSDEMSSSTSSSTTATVAIATSSAVVAQLQMDVSQLATLVAQLQAKISSTATSSVSSSVSAPMIPAPGY